MKDKEKCPVCGCEVYEDIIFRGSDDMSACLGRHGSVNIICCSNCGVLRASKNSLEFRLKK